jgi:putative inorganic carbon (hco3(-)) transporter
VTGRSQRLWTGVLVLTLAWGAAAVGGKHPWAYAPLLYLVTGLALWALAVGRARPPARLVVTLAVLAAAVAIQLVPLAPTTVNAISPATLEVHRQQSLAFALDPTLNVTLSVDPGRTRLGLTFLVVWSLLMIGMARILTRQAARETVGGIAVLGAALAMFGLVQHAVAPFTIYGSSSLTDGGQPFGPFTNRNHFAGWMLMALPLTIGRLAASVSSAMRGVKGAWRDRLLWLASADSSKTLLLAFAVFAMALAAVTTMSRSGMMGLAGALAFSIVVMARRQSSRGRRVLLSTYIAGVAVVVGTWVGLDQIAARFAAPDAIELSGRWPLWHDAFQTIRRFWLTGSGLNTYGVTSIHYQTAMPDAHVAEAHNDYLQLAAEGGLLLGIPILLTIGAFIWHVRQRFREDVGSIWWIRMGAVTGILAVAVQSLAEFSLQRAGNAALFAVLCGIALHDGRPGSRDQPSASGRNVASGKTGSTLRAGHL